MHRLGIRKLKDNSRNGQKADPLIEELIEVEGTRSRLSHIDEARFIVRWEELLVIRKKSKAG